MSLKDEIEKLIKAEQSKLENRDEKHAQYYERQQKRFAPLRAVLEEICASVDFEYLESRFSNDSATLELGRMEGSSRSTDSRWEIEPNYGVRFHAEAGDSLFYEEPGFKVEETEYYRYPEFDMAEDTKTFEDERAVSEFLVRKIVEKVAHYRHLESLAAKRKKGK
ncbi:MAG: hypothetical protein DYH15_00070 [Nitrosomonas sp. PRO4]|nr:hypothetical protein [Nitrosomonas sp. PRO4]